MKTITGKHVHGFTATLAVFLAVVTIASHRAPEHRELQCINYSVIPPLVCALLFSWAGARSASPAAERSFNDGHRRLSGAIPSNRDPADCNP